MSTITERLAALREKGVELPENEKHWTAGGRFRLPGELLAEALTVIERQQLDLELAQDYIWECVTECHKAQAIGAARLRLAEQKYASVSALVTVTERALAEQAVAEFTVDHQRETIADLRERLETVEAALADERGKRTYAHMCRMDHEEIGHNDSENERCPLCRALDELAAERENNYDKMSDATFTSPLGKRYTMDELADLCFEHETADRDGLTAAYMLGFENGKDAERQKRCANGGRRWRLWMLMFPWETYPPRLTDHEDTMRVWGETYGHEPGVTISEVIVAEVRNQVPNVAQAGDERDAEGTGEAADGIA